MRRLDSITSPVAARSFGSSIDMNAVQKIKAVDMKTLWRQVSQTRTIDLPQDPNILDEYIIASASIQFVRLEFYDHGCSAAFMIDHCGADEELAEDNRLRRGYRMTIQRYESETQSETRTS